MPELFWERTTEPSVIGWVPSAQIYFRDPDGHALEFLALLDDAPDADFLGSLSAWQQRAKDPSRTRLRERLSFGLINNRFANHRHQWEYDSKS